MICLTPTTHIVCFSIISNIKFHGKQKQNHNLKFQFKVKSSSSSINSKDVPTPSLLPARRVNVLIPALLPIQALKNVVMFINTFLLVFILPFKGKIGGILMESAEKLTEGKSLVIRVPCRGGKKKGGDATSRRIITIQRVLEDVDERSIRDYELFVTARGNTLFTQSWTPPSSINVKGLVDLLHGVNEYSGRYNDFAKELNTYGFKVYRMDFIGHEGSDVLHAYVHFLDDLVKDLECFLEKVIAENPRISCFCFGHSAATAYKAKSEKLQLERDEF